MAQLTEFEKEIQADYIGFIYWDDAKKFLIAYAESSLGQVYDIYHCENFVKSVRSMEQARRVVEVMQ